MSPTNGPAVEKLIGLAGKGKGVARWRHGWIPLNDAAKKELASKGEPTPVSAYSPLGDLAEKATSKANKSLLPEDHMAAANAHLLAAGPAIRSLNYDTQREANREHHLERASYHVERAVFRSGLSKKKKAMAS